MKEHATDDSRNAQPISGPVLDLAHGLARELAAQGAKAVMLTGSQARGDAYPQSDIDIIAIGPISGYRPSLREKHLVSVSWRTEDDIRESFRKPSDAGEIIPAMRSALAIYDPKGLAAQLKREAEAWTWDDIGDRCDKWVADEITGYAEEVHRLVGHLRLGHTWVAAVQRFVLSCRMGVILSVHLRILYETENRLWDLVARAMGDRWTKAQGASFGTGGQSFDETCAAALELYALTASKIRHLLDEVQYDIVANACEMAGHPLRGRTV